MQDFNFLPYFLIKILQYLLPEIEELGPGLAFKSVSPDLDRDCLGIAAKTSSGLKMVHNSNQ